MDKNILLKTLDILGPKVFGSEYLTYSEESKRLADEMLADWINVIVPVVDSVKAEEELIETIQMLKEEQSDPSLLFPPDMVHYKKQSK